MSNPLPTAGRADGAASAYVIAEIGINHCGDMAIAHRLIDAAAAAGADAAKFQSFRTELLVRRDAERMPYQTAARCGAVSQFEMLKRTELSPEQHRELMAHCRRRGIDFLSTPYDEPSLRMLAEMGVGAIKIASTDVTDRLFLRKVAAAGLPVICSSGVSALWEVTLAVETLRDGGAPVALLHCVSNYPTPEHEVNLRVIGALAAAFSLPAGFSDHTLSLDMGAWAVLAGARIVEKHVTFDKAAVGPDHAASLTAEEFTTYVGRIRAAETALGDPHKRIQPSERAVKVQMQKSLVAARDLPAGAVIDADDLATMRPAAGISPVLVDQVIGRRLLRALRSGETLYWQDIGVNQE